MVRIVEDSLLFLTEERGMVLYAYVIMPDHLHLIAQSPELPRYMRSFKSYTARWLLDLLKGQGYSYYLDKFKTYKLRHRRESMFQVWQEGYHPKQITSDVMMAQKVDYIHRNPVEKGFVERCEDWTLSSAADYMGQAGVIPVQTRWR